MVSSSGFFCFGGLQIENKSMLKIEKYLDLARVAEYEANCESYN